MHTVTLHFTASDKGDNFLAAVGEVLTGDEPSLCSKSKVKDRVFCTYMVEAGGHFDAVALIADRFRDRVQRDEFRLVYVRNNGITEVLRDGGPIPLGERKPRMTSDPADRAAVVCRSGVVRVTMNDGSTELKGTGLIEDDRSINERIASAMDDARELVEEAL